MQASLIANDIDQHTVDGLLTATEEHAGLYRRYLKLKAKLMSLPKLGCQDVIAPVPGTPKVKFEYGKAMELVVEAYEKFDEDYASPVKDMFKRNHLDSSPRFGKQHGAFCYGWYNGKSAFVLSSFNGMLRDVYTLAHELGHATHGYYAQQSQTILNNRIPMVVAETASIFGELLLTDLLLNRADSNEEKKSILCSVLDSAGSVIFKVSARARFEQSLYDAIREGEFLNYETICKHWTGVRDKTYLDTVEWFKEAEAEWTVTPHYYFANFRFYNYPYVYAQLFVYALYQKYLKEGRTFVEEFKKILSAGSSLSPVDIGRIIDLNVADPGFWRLGIKQYEHFLEELERTLE
jgi:oligoendopeptidase F